MTEGAHSSRTVVVTVCVAAGVTLLALVGAVLLRPHVSTTSTPMDPTTSVNAALSCDTGPCESLATVSIGGSTVQLLANAAATSGRVRISTGSGPDSVFETTITKLGASLTKQSLTCLNSQSPVCMVSGTAPDGSAGEVFIDTGGEWSRAQAPYFASGGYLSLGGLSGTSAAQPEIITVQSDCDSDVTTDCAQSPVYVQVFSISGQSVGCTNPVSHTTRLPGWPTVRVSADSLHPC